MATGAIKYGFTAALLLVMPLLTTAQAIGTSSEGDCQASFSVALDSLASLPYIYQFKDHSTGNITSWSWDFGDGNSSSIQHPVHRYENEGTYQVCLTVTDINNPSNCLDQVCQEINTREYYSLGGLVFAGDYPLNNPIPAGDTGVAYLYRAIGDQLVFLQDQSFHEYGYYGFGHILPGKYLVKIGLAKGSTHYGNYFTTYSGNGIRWQYAPLFIITDSSHYADNISLLKVGFINAGTGIISGRIKYEQFNNTDLPAPDQTTVILSNHQQVPLRYTLPDEAGYYAFNGLPTGTYYISADATGKPSTMVTITLTDTYLIADNVNLTIFGSSAQGVPEAPISALSVSPVYPNPARDVLNIVIQSPDKYLTRVLVTDPAGRIYLDQAVSITPGKNYLRVPVHHLQKGIYSVLVDPGQQSATTAAKFIK